MAQPLRDLSKALIITRREVRDQFRDWRIIFPVLVLTVFFPGLMNFTARQAVDFVGRYGAPIIAERLIPFLLMVVGFFPISVSLVIALESFVGEKERRSIEPLLVTPLSDSQLYLGKLLAAMVPTLLASYLGITVYLVGIYRQIGWSAEPSLLTQIVLLTTIQAIVMVAGAVVVSTQTTSVRAANLLASFIIIPMALLIQGEAIVMFWGTYSILWWAIIGLLIIATLIVRTGVAYFNREEMLGRELDVLNFRWAWSIFWSSFKGQARSPLQWYWQEILPALKATSLPLLAMLVALIIGLVAGASQAAKFPIPAEMLEPSKLEQGVQGLELLQFISPTGIALIFLQNLRVLALATLLGIFSFGVLGMLVTIAPLALISYVAANVASAGLSPTQFFFALVLPHGIVEIPAMILAGAAILNLGATLIAPSQGKTLGEAFLHALGRWVRLMFGLILPLFLLAAILEVYLTPRIAVILLGS